MTTVHLQYEGEPWCIAHYQFHRQLRHELSLLESLSTNACAFELPRDQIEIVSIIELLRGVGIDIKIVAGKCPASEDGIETY